MAKQQSIEFVAGVIEGFYGPPWSLAERLQLFDWMATCGLNTYFYAPKDDLKHRAIWREPYSETELTGLGDVVQACQSRGIQFLYALSPGLDIRYNSLADLTFLQNRFEQMIRLGCTRFALLFDDIPDRMDSDDLSRWGSLASAQSYIANSILGWLRERRSEARLFFCPTPYCSRMAAAHHGGADYLGTIGRELLAEIDIFWTGPEIISREITLQHAVEIGAVLRRKPVIWDNLHANDYDGRRFFCGPYAGRPLELRGAVRGLFINPNCELPLNFVPFHTLGSFVRTEAEWNPREAWLTAMLEWWPNFVTVGEAIELKDLILFGDCYYLPFEEGPEAEKLMLLARRLLGSSPAKWSADDVVKLRNACGRLRALCGHLAGLRSRPLFNALARRVWDLREEMDLLDRYIDFKSQAAKRELPFTSDFHLPGTYCGGVVAALQRLLVQKFDGTFAPSEEQPPLTPS